MNNVNLIGSVVNEPELSIERDGRDVCAIQLAVQRRGPTGDPEPGVIYIDVTAYGRRARQCKSELAVGDRIGVAAALGAPRPLGAPGPPRPRWGGHALQARLLAGPAPAAASPRGLPAPPPSGGLVL